MSWRKRPICAPSVARWSNEAQRAMTGRIPMVSPVGVSITTGRFTIASIEMIAIWGMLMIGWLVTEPNQPVLFTVIVFPTMAGSAPKRCCHAP